MFSKKLFDDFEGAVVLFAGLRLTFTIYTFSEPSSAVTVIRTVLMPSFQPLFPLIFTVAFSSFGMAVTFKPVMLLFTLIL